MYGMPSSTVVAENLEDSIITSRLLGSSISSLPSSRQGKSHISKVYREASTLFLTRRLAEALSTLEPLITTPRSSASNSDDEEGSEAAPVASASKNTRIKVWKLYLALLNAIIELGPEDGKNIFGTKEWRNLVAKVRDGTIWEHVVKVGYNGIEGSVDADIVTSLATLLLTHSPTQATNQQRLETYLSSTRQPDLDLVDRLRPSEIHEGYSPPRKADNNGTNTPRDLNSRIKIIELYTLHVLPRSEEWQYAKDFISMSEVLDEERREVFLLTLQSLEHQMIQERDREADILRERDEELERGRAQAERRRLQEIKAEEKSSVNQQVSKIHRRSDSEKDYGIEGSRPENPSKPRSSRSDGKSDKGIQESRTQLSPNSRSRSASKKSPTTSLYKQGLAIISSLQHLISNITHSLSRDPTILLRTILFMVGLILAFSRREARERVRRITGVGWDKLKGTVGMGVKISYI